MRTLLLAATLAGVAWASVAQAARLDCGQPSSTGARPVPTDALFVLRAAVKLSVCDVCLCDVDGSGSIAATDSLRVLKFAVGQPVVLACPACPVPSITIESPAPLTTVADNRIDVTGTVADAVSVSCNSTAASRNASSFSANVRLREGVNTIACVAIGPVGHASTATVSVTSDLTPPRITITSPPDGFVTMSATIDVTGSVQDLVTGTAGTEPITVLVEGIPAEVANGSFFASGITIPSGGYFVEASAADPVGNESFTRIFVDYRETVDQKTIRRVSGSGQTASIGAVLSQPLVAELLDDVGQPIAGETVTFRVVQGDGTIDGKRSVARTTDASGRASAVFRVGTHAGVGDQRVEARAIGVQDPAVFLASATAGAPAKLLIDAGNNQTGSVGQALPMPLSVVVVDDGNNRLANVPVTYEVVEGGGNFDGANEMVATTDLDGRAHAVLVLGAAAGIENNRVEVVLSPGDFPTTFVASAMSGSDPSSTRVSGVVVDNSDVPVPGATIRIFPDGTSTETDGQGQVTIMPVSVGSIILQVDGTTTSRQGTWPIIDFEMVTVAGVDNDLGRPIYLVRLDRGSSLFVSRTQGGTITLEDYPGFSLQIAPDSARFPNGSREGFITVTYVHTDKVPMTPNLGQQPDFVVTIQPPGVRFDPPAPVAFPNVAGLPPGRVLELMSFDHDVGRFVSIGTGSVSRDGATIASDPGIGIIKGGWHATPGLPPTGAARPVFVDITQPGPIELMVGDTLVLSADGDPAPGGFSWASDDPAVVGVVPGSLTPPTSNAEIEALEIGEATISATYAADSGASDTDTVQVTVRPNVHLRPGIVAVVSTPDTKQLKAFRENSDGSLTDVTSDPETEYEWIGAAGDLDVLRDPRIAALVNTALNKLVDKLGQDFQVANVTIDANGLLTASSPGFQVVRAVHAGAPSNPSIVLIGVGLKSLDLKPAFALQGEAGATTLLRLLLDSLADNPPLVLGSDFRPWVTDAGWLRVENVKFEFLDQFEISYQDLFDAIEPLIKKVARAVVPDPLVDLFVDAANEVGKFAATQFVDFKSNDDGLVATVGSEFGVIGKVQANNPGISVATGTLDLSSFDLGKKSDSVMIWVLPRIETAELRPSETILHVDDPAEPGAIVRAYGQVTGVGAVTVAAPSTFEDVVDFLDKLLPGGSEKWLSGIFHPPPFQLGGLQLELKGRYAITGDTVEFSPPGLSMSMFLPTALVDMEPVDSSIADVGTPVLEFVNGRVVHKSKVGETLLSLTTSTGGFGERLLDVGRIVVTAAQMVGLEIEPDAATVEIGDVHLYRAYARFDDGSRSEVTGSATWTSGDDAIAFVGPFGFARGLAQGQTTVRAEYEGFADTAVLRVAGLVSIDVQPPNDTVLVGESTQYRAIGTFDDGSTADITDNVLWSSDDTSVAFMDVTGEAIGDGTGATVVRAAKGVLSDSATIDVLSFDSIDVAPAVASGCVGDQLFFVATAHRPDSSTIDVTAAVTWTSSDPGIVSVTPGGAATLLADGSSEISASLAGITGNTVSVTATAFDAIRITPTAATILVGATQSFTALRSCAGVLGATLDGVLWQSSSTSIGTIASDGTLTGRAAGQTTVTASKDTLVSNGASVEVLAQSPVGGAILVISEVVEQPVQDWDDSAGGDGIPFNAMPGSATPDPVGDQWVEIFNASPSVTAGVNGFMLTYLDQTGNPASVTLNGAIPPGGFLVVTGAALGGMALDSPIELRHSSGLILDSVDMGTLRSLVGPAGTVNGEGMARQRIPTQVPQDWKRVRATIAAANATP